MYPSHAAPDMSLLTLVKLSEITQGRSIGSGAFGTVYEVRVYTCGCGKSDKSLKFWILCFVH